MALYLSSLLRSKLIHSILASMSELEFREFTKNDSFGMLYEKSISGNIGLDIGSGMYVDKLVRLGTISVFIEELLKARKTNPDVKAFYEELQRSFENVDMNWQVRKESFQRYLMRKKTLPFIGRTNFSDTLTKLVNGQINDIIILRGQPGCGATYINFYLLEIEEKFECFKYFYININKIRKYYPNEIITAAHIAEVIATQLGIEFNLKEFKLIIFIGDLKRKLEKLAKEEKVCLFFFDQFNESKSKEKKLIAEDIQLLIDEMIDLVVQNGMSYIVLSAYDNYNKNWPGPVKTMAAKVDFTSFTAQQVDIFLENLYVNPEIDFTVKINRETFFAAAKATLPQGVFDLAEESNVMVIGETLTDWLEKLMTDLNMQNNDEG